jgi:alpha-beta hydrolase superfamily lysophospholipase
MHAEAIEFPSAGGTCRGALYRTDRSADEPPGVVILAHGLSGTRLTQYDRRARRLVQDGVAVLDFDPRFVGTSPGTPRQRIDAFAWLADLRAAVAHVRSRDDVDARRLGLYGSSLGGGLSLAVAEEDPGIRALALDVPAIDGMRATPSPLRSRPALVAAVARDVLGRWRGRPPVLLPVFGEVGSGAVVQNDVDGFWRAMDEIEGIEWIEWHRLARHSETGEWRNEATALELMNSLRLRPARRAAAVRCPVLAHLSEDDRVVPFEPTRKALGRITTIEIRTLRGGHFAPFYGEGFETTVAAQAEFFARELAPA